MRKFQPTRAGRSWEAACVCALVSAKLRGGRGAGEGRCWPPPVGLTNSVGTFSKSRTTRPPARSFRAPARRSCSTARPPRPGHTATPPPENCPLVASYLLVTPRHFDIRVTRPRPQTGPPSDADTQNLRSQHTSRGRPRAVSGKSVGYGTRDTFCRDSQTARLSRFLASPGFPSLTWDAVIGATAQTDVTRPYLPLSESDLPSQAPAATCLAYLLSRLSYPTLGLQCCQRCRGPPRSGDDATLMIYIPFTEHACSGVSEWPQGCVARHPLFPPSARRRASSFYWPRQLPTTPEMPAPDERAAELVQAPPASRTCPAQAARHSARPPRPSDNGDLQPATSRFWAACAFLSMPPTSPLDVILVAAGC